ncbi:MAG TPA: hypothetical protein VN698_00790, partial [Bacteroidia bacterium]|nr:hypothetical protein [Bacteroidia bacterium]
MLLPQRKITFTNAKTGATIEYDYVCDIEINRSLDVLTDTATITIPRKLIFKSGDALTIFNQNNIKDYVTLPAFNDTKDTAYAVGADALFKRGDKVKIEIGFYPNLQTRFTGYITDVSSTLPIKISCEDKMWLLKQTNVVFPDKASYVDTPRPKNYDKTKDFYTLQQLLDGILSSVDEKITYSTTLGSFNVGNTSYNNQSVAQVLESLKDSYSLYSHFKDDGKLYVEFYNNVGSNNVQEFVMEDVVINNDTLEWSNLEDLSVKVQGISVNADNTTITYEVFNRGKLIITQFDDAKT